MSGAGWISVRVCSKSDGIVFQFISFYLIIIIAAVLVSLSTHVVRARGVGNLLPAARLTRARVGGLALARGVLLGILDLAGEALVRLAGDMPAVLVDVGSRTIRPRGLAVDLRRACVSGLEGSIDTNPRTNLP